jgi:hypothetical protein
MSNASASTGGVHDDRPEFGEDLRADSVPHHVERPSELSPADVLPTLTEVERDHIVRVLLATDGNKVRAAQVLGISRGTLLPQTRRVSDPGVLRPIHTDVGDSRVVDGALCSERIRRSGSSRTIVVRNAWCANSSIWERLASRAVCG